MLIHIDGTAVSDAVSGGATSALSRACVENLLLAHFDGNHVISLLPGDVGSLLASTPPWSDRARRAMENIDELYSQIEGLRESVAWSLELGIGEGFDGREHAVRGGRKVVRAGLHRFHKMHMTSCSVLMGENQTDAELFRELGLMRRAERRWERVEMIHALHGAGGSTFASELRSLADRGYVLLAIADSDRRHPSGSFGGTYTKLREEARGLPAYQRVRPLHTRTAEGLVPLPVYREAFRFPREHGDPRLGSLARLEVFVRSAPAPAVLYADYKNGITLHEVQSASSASERAYWVDIASGARRGQCIRPSGEECSKREECQCYVVDALGDRALAAVVAWSKSKKSKRELASRFGLSDDPELSALSDEVLAWGLALSPLLA